MEGFRGENVLLWRMNIGLGVRGQILLFTSSVTMKSDFTFLGFIFCTCKTGLINIYCIRL